MEDYYKDRIVFVPKHGRNMQSIISIKSAQSLYLKNNIINEGISIIGLAEVNINWGKIPIRENIYNRTDGWFKTRSISTGYNKVTISGGPFQSRGTDIMMLDKVP